MNYDSTDFININQDDGISEAVYMLIDQIIEGGSLVTPIHCLRAAVKDAEIELLNADMDAPVYDEGDAIDAAMSAVK